MHLITIWKYSSNAMKLQETIYMLRSLVEKKGFRYNAAAVSISTAVLIPGANSSWVVFESFLHWMCLFSEAYHDTLDCLHPLSALFLYFKMFPSAVKRSSQLIRYAQCTNVAMTQHHTATVYLLCIVFIVCTDSVILNDAVSWLSCYGAPMKPVRKEITKMEWAVCQL